MLGKLRRRFGLRREQAANHVLPALPEEGHLYSFRTRPYTPFSASETGRYAALKVLGVTDKLVVIATLEPVWPSHPSLKEAAGARVLSQYRLAHKGREAIVGILKETWDIADALDDCRLLGSVPVSARDQYDLAYGSILRQDYPAAEQQFREFVRRNPSDRQVGDAHFWIGESLFQRQRYKDAADSFLTVSTRHGRSAKAPDALLRLGQSLAALNEKEAACATFAEVARKYPNASASVRAGVSREQQRARC